MGAGVSLIVCKFQRFEYIPRYFFYNLLLHYPGSTVFLHLTCQHFTLSINISNIVFRLKHSFFFFFILKNNLSN
jgi:hypothetical protein